MRHVVYRNQGQHHESYRQQGRPQTGVANTFVWSRGTVLVGDSGGRFMYKAPTHTLKIDINGISGTIRLKIEATRYDY